MELSNSSMDKSRKPKPPMGPKGPRKPCFQKFDDKSVLKQFSMTIKSYKDIKTADTGDGLMLYGMPVFKAGTHRGFEYTDKWIDKFLIGQFDANDDVPIQRDHSDESYATLGYVKKLYREGDMVYADMLLIDETAISRWKKGLMKKWSVGISREFKLAEISAVAFPYIREARVHSDADEIPQTIMMLTNSGTSYSVSSIKTADLGESVGLSSACNFLQTAYSVDNTSTYTYTGTNPNFHYDFSTGVIQFNQEGDLKVELEQLKADKIALEAQLKESNDKIKSNEDAIKAKDVEIENYKKAKSDADFAHLKASVDTEVKELVKEGKIAPAREKSLVDSLCKMSEDSRKEVVQTFKESGKISELDENGHVKVEKTKQEFKDGDGKFEFDGKVYDISSMSAEAVNTLAETYAKKNELGTSEALDIIYEKSRPNN